MALAYDPLFITSDKSPIDIASPPPPPSSMILTQDELKRIAAYKAVDFVKSGMVLGLGTGSTARHAVDRIGELLRQGKLENIVGIPTSEKTEEQALSSASLSPTSTRIPSSTSPSTAPTRSTREAPVGRREGEAFVTDNGNYIVDMYLEKDMGDLRSVSDEILRLPGVVEHGMFLDMASTVIIAGELGVRIKNKHSSCC
ncbi:hypothetical protein Bca52824_071670 [Brassica carinata]|uniref:ribose-5-phosphate isomerase n=1 Tax=Brassica carinata TaxID=52824 RepID=A0A8X7U684_BRACI|nr:hypothetical protein Bca52824_071670 [Brassica carinata]